MFNEPRIVQLQDFKKEKEIHDVISHLQDLIHEEIVVNNAAQIMRLMLLISLKLFDCVSAGLDSKRLGG